MADVDEALTALAEVGKSLAKAPFELLKIVAKKGLGD